MYGLHPPQQLVVILPQTRQSPESMVEPAVGAAPGGETVFDMFKWSGTGVRDSVCVW